MYTTLSQVSSSVQASPSSHADPLGTLAQLRESSDPARECHERSLRPIHALMGEADFTAKEILDRCRPCQGKSGSPEALVWDALSECIRGDLTSAALGRGPFKQWRDSILVGLRLERAGKLEPGVALETQRAGWGYLLSCLFER